MKEFLTNFKQSLLKNEKFDFEVLALKAFKFQANHSPIYKEFLGHLGINPHNVEKVSQIPFLPISLFKEKKIILEGLEPEIEFLSSGTTQQIRSRKLVNDLAFYKAVARKGFEQAYGPLKDYHFFFSLPGYGELESSSLLTMAEHFFQNSDQRYGGFFSADQERLESELMRAKDSGRTCILFGVTHSLLGLKVKTFGNPLLVIETGGMKGRGKEIIRREVHQSLMENLSLNQIGSEYGMAELNSQAYALSDGHFYTPLWMKIMVRDMWGPMDYLSFGKTGALNIIDLANIESCCFIATDDLGRLNPDGSFDMIGRLDQSDLRGCNLLFAS